MDTDSHRSETDGLTEKIIGAAFDVHNEMGFGFLEKVYENALAHLLRKRGLKVDQQAQIRIIFDDVEVGHYIADLVIEGEVLVELKSVESICSEHLAQVLNYLKATRLPLALILNFGKKSVEIKRLRMN